MDRWEAIDYVGEQEGFGLHLSKKDVHELPLKFRRQAKKWSLFSYFLVEIALLTI